MAPDDSDVDSNVDATDPDGGSDADTDSTADSSGGDPREDLAARLSATVPSRRAYGMERVASDADGGLLTPRERQYLRHAHRLDESDRAAVEDAVSDRVGEFVAAGDLAGLNQYTANPPRIEAYEWFERNVPDDHQCVFLNAGEHLDLADDSVSQPSKSIDQAAKQAYVDEVPADRTFDYERAPMPAPEELYDRLPAAYEKFDENHRWWGSRPTRPCS